MRKNAMIAFVLLLLSTLCAGCGSSAVTQEKVNTEDAIQRDLITVGFSQLGAESDWRSANTESMQEALSEENGFNLIYKNGQQKQSNQITAIRMFIQQGVDYIVLAPAMETGWDSVLSEAREAGIPVIIVDRRADVDKNLYSCWVGSDFELEGKKVTTWLNEYTKKKGIAPEDIHIVNIQGTIGSTAQIGRSRGLANASREYGWDLLDEVSGDFTETKGREVMTSFLRKYDNINVVYCENDNEAIGAIEAIENAGRKVGSDIAGGEIMIVSFDAVNQEAISYAREGKIACIAECNPHHGPRVRALIEALHEGSFPDKFNYVSEKLYSSLPDVETIVVDGITYSIDEFE
jgi:simple sugar transport system substrate-binding protein